jgi:AAA family ATP:ADP antiporter
MTAVDPEAPKPSSLDRALRIFTDVRPGEGRVAVMMFANVLLILCAYYFVKPLREGWLAISDIEGLSKMELKAYSSFGQSLLLVFIVGAYGRLVARLPPVVLITRATLFCMSNLLIFWLLQPGFLIDNLPYSGIAFYLWVGMFGVFVVAQFWAFAADLYDDEQGKRLLPLIAIGATSGATIGSWLAETAVESARLGSSDLMLAALAPLTASIVLTRACTAERAQRATPSPTTPESAEPARQGAISLVLDSRFLLSVAVITMILNWVNTNGENMLFRVVQEMLEGAVRSEGIEGQAEVLAYVRDGTTAFYGSFFFWVNLVALFLQSIIASRMLKYGGFASVFLLLPVIALLSYSVIALLPILWVVKLMKIAENATDYSINNMARHVLWLPVPSDVTYKAKPTVDTLFARLGDGLAALTVMFGVQALTLSVESFAAINIVLIGAWILIALWTVRAHRELTGETEASEVGS